MELVSVLERAAGVDLADAGRDEVRGMLSDLARLSGWIEARRVAGYARLQQLPEVTYPEVDVAEVTRERAADVQRLMRRVDALMVFPRFAKALEVGEIGPSHVDAVVHGIADVPVDRRDRLVALQDSLLDSASQLSGDRFSKVVRAAVTRVLCDEDVREKAKRQRQATALAMWLNKPTGMMQLRGQFDPETGAELLARLESARQLLYPQPDALPDSCPTDPGGREDHLRAWTLTKLLLDPDQAPGWRPETLLVVDQPTLHGGIHEHSIVDAGVDVDLPHDALRRLAAKGRTVKVTMRDGIVTSVGGRTKLDRGRRSRLASFDQRRALRAMYPTCPIEDCPVRFRHTQIHHIQAWEDGGTTDLANLLPACTRHHHLIHHQGWSVTLDPATRYLTLTKPDGTHTTRPPPYATAA